MISKLLGTIVNHLKWMTNNITPYSEESICAHAHMQRIFLLYADKWEYVVMLESQLKPYQVMTLGDCL